MSIIQYHIDPEEITINRKVIAKLLGVDTENIPEPYLSMIKSEIDRLPEYNQIGGGVKLVEDPEIDKKNSALVLNNIRFQAGRQVVNYLFGSEKIALFLCTAGEGISKRSKELMKNGELLEGYVCDVIGSVLVEEAMTIIHNRINEKLAESGERTTNRYSPGYCEWDVAEQHKLFQFFPEGFCGIKLSPSALMHPVKSVSGVFGIGKEVKYHKYVCNACHNVNCIYRNLKYTV